MNVEGPLKSLKGGRRTHRSIRPAGRPKDEENLKSLRQLRRRA